MMMLKLLLGVGVVADYAHLLLGLLSSSRLELRLLLRDGLGRLQRLCL